MALKTGDRVIYTNTHDNVEVPPQNGDQGMVVQAVTGGPFVKVFWDVYGVVIIVHAKHLREAV